MKKIICLLIVVIILSCESNTIYKKPKDLISESVMVDLLVDLYIAKEASVYEKNNNKTIIPYSVLVYNKYKIDVARFDRSNFYYTSEIELYNKIYEKVMSRLESKKSVIDSLMNPIDSLNIKKGDLIKGKDSLIKLEKIKEPFKRRDKPELVRYR
ncbi:MAG: DUF4296 domain-containing protein [Flavobacteriaceae bacterium]|nr:DUF4296 domain-containing protein [Flavobacteriaceae bacterium]